MSKIKYRRWTVYEPLNTMPADGWKAVYAYLRDGTYAHARPLVAWVVTKQTAVMSRAGGDRIEEDDDGDFGNTLMGYALSENGGDGCAVPVCDIYDFIGFLEPGEDISLFEDEARDYVEKLAESQE